MLLFLQLKDTNLSSLLCVTFTSTEAEPGAKNSAIVLVLAVELELVQLGAGLCKSEQGDKALWLHPMHLDVRVENCLTVLDCVATSRYHCGTFFTI